MPAFVTERVAGLGGLAPVRIEPHVADLDRPFRRRGPGVGATQDGADASDHLARAERLDDVVVGAELEADDPIGFLTARGEHDDRHLRGSAQLAADVVAGAVRQHYVEQDEVGAEALRQIQ